MNQNSGIEILFRVLHRNLKYNFRISKLNFSECCYLAVAVDASHFAPGLDARMPLLAILEDVAFESAAAGREDVDFASSLGLLAQQLLVGQQGRRRLGGRGRRCRTLLATGHRVRPVSFALLAAQRRAGQFRALHFQSHRLENLTKN